MDLSSEWYCQCQLKVLHKRLKYFFLLKKGESSKTKIEIISTGKKETYEIYNKINKKFCPWSKWSHL